MVLVVSDLVPLPRVYNNAIQYWEETQNKSTWLEARQACEDASLTLANFQTEEHWDWFKANNP